MAREFAPIKLSIWADDDFRALSPGAQHLYFVLLTSKTLSHCGVADWRPVRIAALSRGWTARMVDDSGRELAENLYLVVDESTEEVLLRSFIRNDGLMKQPKMAVAMGRAHDVIASSAIRGVVVHELQRLRLDFPDLNGWKAEKAIEILQLGSADPSTYPTGYGMKSAEERGSETLPERVSGEVSERENTDVPEGVPNSLLLSPSSLLPTPGTSTPQEKPTAEPPRADVAELCERLQRRITEAGSKTPTITATWRTEARLLLDRDGRELGKALALIDWALADEFWRSNIASMPTFRKQYDRLRLKANAEFSERAQPGSRHDAKVAGYLAFANEPERVELA